MSLVKYDRKRFWQNMMGITTCLIIVSLVAERMGLLEKNRPEAAETAGRTARGGQRRVVVIDSGHGGADPGKIGVAGQSRKKQLTCRLPKS